MASVLESKLVGLKRVVVISGIRGGKAAKEFNNAVAKGSLNGLAAPLLMLESLAISHATVVAYTLLGPNPRTGVEPVSRDLADRWATDVERRLTAPSDGLTYVTRLKKPRADARERDAMLELERRKQRRADGRLRAIKD